MAIASPRSIVIPLLPKLIVKFPSASATLDYLKTQGLGYRRHTFLADYRAAKGLVKQKNTIKYTRKKYRISTESMAPAFPGQRSRYNYRVKLRYINKFTNEPEESWVTILSQKNLTIEEIEENAWTRAILFGSRYEIANTLGAEVTGASYYAGKF